MTKSQVSIALLCFIFIMLGALVAERYLTPDLDEEFLAVAASGGDLSKYREALPPSGFSRVYRIGATPNSLRIVPGADNPKNYFLRLTDAETGHPVVDFFVRAGHDEMVRVPNGVLRLHEATGDAWYGYSRLFGPDTTFTEIQTNIVFSGDEHYVISFNSSNGNLTSKDISKRDF